MPSLLGALELVAAEFQLEVIGRPRAGFPRGPDLTAEVERQAPDIVVITLDSCLEEGGIRELEAILGSSTERIVVGIDPRGRVALRTLLFVGEVTLPQRVLALARSALELQAEGWLEEPIGAGPDRTYGSSAEHLDDELGWLAMRVRRALEEPCSWPEDRERQRRQLVAALDPSEPCTRAEIEVRAQSRRKEIDRRVLRSIASGRELGLRRLVRAFRLGEHEASCLLLAIGAAVVPDLQRALALLGGNSGLITPQLAALVFGQAEGTALADALDPEGTLARLACLLPASAPGWRIDPEIVAFVRHGVDPVGEDARAPRDASLPALWADPEQVAGLAETLRTAETAPEPRPRLLVTLLGHEGAGRRSLAERALERANLALHSVDVGRLLDADDFELALRRALRCARLGGALALDHFERALRRADPEGRARLERLEAALAEHSRLTLCVSEEDWSPGAPLRSALHVRVQVGMPVRAAGPGIWQSEFTARGWELGGGLSGELGARFRLRPGDVRAAASAASALAYHGRRSVVPGRAELFSACRARTGRGLADFAVHVEPRSRLQDIVLAPRVRGQLLELVAHVEHDERVLGAWGFQDKLVRDRGVTALFSGPSGTGKSMSVEGVARRLGLELWRIDLARVLSKYIGETEQHLRELFERAEGNCVLHFEEADTLFARRTEVRDSHDRYANVEVGYLLQRMEEYEGVAILSTNLRRNIDEAFVRRLRFIVEFGLPDAEQRERIWRKATPDELPLGADVDLAFLARKLEFSGGSIRNVAVRAAFLAAAVGARAVGMRHFVMASASELKKTGKPFDPALFQAYSEWLEVFPAEAEDELVEVVA